MNSLVPRVNASAEANGLKISDNTFKIELFKDAKFEFFKKEIVQKITQNILITAEDRDKICEDLFLRLRGIIEEKFDQIKSDIGTKKIIGESLNCLASSDKSNYKEKVSLLEGLLAEKLKNIEDEKTHYLVMEAIDAIKMLTRDELRYLSIIVFITAYSAAKKVSRVELKDYLNKICLPNDFTKTLEYGNHILQRLSKCGLIMKGGVSGIRNSAHDNKLKEWFSCDDENSLEDAVNETGYDKKLILIVRNVNEVTYLGEYLGQKVLKNLGVI